MIGETPTLVILGASGSGKTHVAAELGRILSRPVVENDALVEARRGATVAQQMVDDPERALEDLCRGALELLVAGGPGAGAIIALSPSSIECAGVRDALAAARDGGTRVVALTAPLDVLVRRNGLNAPQPNPVGAPRAWFRGQLARLEDAYSQVADFWCDTGTTDSTISARLIAEALGLGGPRPPEND